MLAGTGSQGIMESARKMLGTVEGWKNPFGEGNAGQRITKIIGN